MTQNVVAEALACVLGSERIVGVGRLSGDQPRKCPHLAQSLHLRIFGVWEVKPNLYP